MIRVAVTPDPIGPAVLLDSLQVPGAGAVASFTGIVRADDGVTRLELEHYPGMTEAALTALGETARAKFALLGAVIVHRVGAMLPGEPVVFIACAATHRADALAACAMLIDRIKTDAPFWKREHLATQSRWVDARAADEAAAAKW